VEGAEGKRFGWGRAGREEGELLEEVEGHKVLFSSNNVYEVCSRLELDIAFCAGAVVPVMGN